MNKITATVTLHCAKDPLVDDCKEEIEVKVEFLPNPGDYTCVGELEINEMPTSVRVLKLDEAFLQDIGWKKYFGEWFCRLCAYEKEMRRLGL